MSCYKQEPQPRFENCSYKLYYDWSITTDRTAHNNRPVRVMLDKTIKQEYLSLFHVSISYNQNLYSTFSEREAPYTDTKEELTRIWQMDVVYIIPLKGKGIPRQAEVALGVPGRLKQRICSTFGTTRVVSYQPNAPAAFTPGEIPGTHFQRLSRPQGTWFCRKDPRKKSQVTPPGIDPGTVRLVAQRLNHYATPDPH